MIGAIQSFSCEDFEINGTTKIYVRRRTLDRFEARVGIAIMGTTNMDLHILKNLSPFDDEKFRDNFASGKGKSKEEAIENLRADVRDLQSSIWN